jgi:hypothetical protein
VKLLWRRLRVRSQIDPKLAARLSTPAISQAAAASALRLVRHVDLSSFDPVQSSV